MTSPMAGSVLPRVEQVTLNDAYNLEQVLGQSSNCDLHISQLSKGKF